jgi:hypothetical protein
MTSAPPTQRQSSIGDIASLSAARKFEEQNLKKMNRNTKAFSSSKRHLYGFFQLSPSYHAMLKSPDISLARPAAVRHRVLVFWVVTEGRAGSAGRVAVHCRSGELQAA